MLKKLLLWSAPFVAMSLLSSCSTQEVPSTITFEGDVSGAYSIQLRNADGTFSVVDTLEILGDDVFEISFDTTRMVSFLPITGELPVVHAVVGPSTTKLTVNEEGYISGDAENNWLGAQREMQLDLIAFIERLDAIRETYTDSTTFNGLQALDSSFYAYAEQYRSRILDTLTSKPELLSNMMLVYHRIGQNPVVDYIVDRELFIAARKALEKAYPGSDDVAAFGVWVDGFEESYQFSLQVKEAAIKFTPGHPFPEFTLETPEGKLVHLPKMGLENEIVAIWASWCNECRRELRGFAKNNDVSNLTLLSIDGLPQQRSPLGEWYEAIQQDQLLEARHLSDLKGSRSNIVSTLGVDELPLYFKVDRGIITQRVSSIAELE
jgi:hypothetical protein